MYCEVCGKKIKKAYVVKIEGTEMKTCRECAKFGVEFKKYSRLPPVKTVETRKPSIKKKVKPKIEPEYEINEEYSSIIRKKRESMGLSREEFGKLINEKASVIARLESGKMVPDIKLAKKLEKTFRIKLLEKVEETEVRLHSSAPLELTIGDVIKIKKK